MQRHDYHSAPICVFNLLKSELSGWGRLLEVPVKKPRNLCVSVVVNSGVIANRASSNSGLGPVSRKSRNSSGVFRVT